MRIPLEYGDNFPVLTGGWNPAIPRRFPKHEILPRRRGWFSHMLPWLTLGLGVTLGALWMNWFVESPAPSQTPILHPEPIRTAPAHRPIRLRSRLA